mmetsp:Transcript_49466/g.115681  ORF Transcript_49466/g.115681 Transcript_49466/m.115681 type:complete len:563 (-) Transcript_49466:70-1758(-)
MPAKGKKRRPQKTQCEVREDASESESAWWQSPFWLLVILLLLAVLSAPLYLHQLLTKASDADALVRSARNKLRGSEHSLLDRGLVDEKGYLRPEYEAALEAAAMRHEAEEQHQPVGELLPVDQLAIVVVSHACEDCLRRCLSALYSQADGEHIQVFVSLDGQESFERMHAEVKRKDPDGKRIQVWRKMEETPGSAALKIAGHFQFVLGKVFDEHQFAHAIFLEDDLLLAPDFLFYFRYTAWLLREDPTLFCVSAWHDNGFQGIAIDEERLFRTGYFPGLGWMIRRETWDLVKPIWPQAPTTGWDHWIRHGSGLQPRECVVPEVSRTYHFNEQGTNVKKDSGIARKLKKMVLAKLPPGHLGNLSYLLSSTYEETTTSMLRSEGIQLLQDDELYNIEPEGAYIIPYVRETFTPLAKQLLIYAGEPRASHFGLIETRHAATGAKLFLVDRRQGERWLPEPEQVHPSPGMKVAAANPGESCAGHCLSIGMHCSELDLEYVNTCAELKKAFPCEHGCGHQAGKEIPCYVHDETRDTSLQCLVTDTSISKCAASHQSTTRLCACVPDA